MTLRDFVFTVVGGLIVWVLQQVYLNRREGRRDRSAKLVRPSNLDRILPADIFEHLSPGDSMSLAREMLGNPNRHSRSDFSVFLDDQVETNSYLYVFKNGYVKITSKDNETVDTITVKPTDRTILVPALSPFAGDDEEKPSRIGELKLLGITDDVDRHTFIQSRWDASFALQYYTGAPLYLDHTYFGFSIDKREEYLEKNDPSVFNGEIVDAVCVSRDSDAAFYIYDTEVV